MELANSTTFIPLISFENNKDNPRCGVTRNKSARRRDVMGCLIVPNRITKDGNSNTTAAMSDARHTNSMQNAYDKTGTTHYHTRLGHNEFSLFIQRLTIWSC